MTLDKYIEAMMSDNLRQLHHELLTLSHTNNVGHYQSGDACLEQINKEAKIWISQVGVPSDESWVKVFRNLDELNQVIFPTII